MNDGDDDLKIVDSDNFRNFGGGNYGFRELAMEQYRRCCVEGSKSMLEGQERLVFMNAVKVLEVIVSPYFLNHPKLADQINKSNDKIKELETACKKIVRDKKYGEDIDAKNRRLDEEYTIELYILHKDRLAIMAQLMKNFNYFETGSASG